MRRRRFTRTRKEKRKKKKTRQTVSDDTRPSAGGPRALTGAPAVPSRAGPRGHRLAGSKRPGGGGGAPRLDAAGRGCSPQPRGGRARQPRGSPPSSCPGAALELVSRFELTMRRCAKKPRDRARDPGRRGARAARSEAPPETGSRTPRGSSRATAVARSVSPNPDPIRERPDPGAPERFFSVRLPRRDARLWKSRNGNEKRPARTAQPAPRAWPCTRARRGITRTGPRRRSSGSSCVTGAKHRTAHRRGCVVWHRRLIRLPETSSVKTSGRKRRTSRAEIHPDSRVSVSC